VSYVIPNWDFIVKLEKPFVEFEVMSLMTYALAGLPVCTAIGAVSPIVEKRRGRG
jgi:hypothetical protein